MKILLLKGGLGNQLFQVLHAKKDDDVLIISTVLLKLYNTKRELEIPLEILNKNSSQIIITNSIFKTLWYSLILFPFNSVLFGYYQSENVVSMNQKIWLDFIGETSESVQDNGDLVHLRGTDFNSKLTLLDIDKLSQFGVIVTDDKRYSEYVIERDYNFIDTTRYNSWQLFILFMSYRSIYGNGSSLSKFAMLTKGRFYYEFNNYGRF